VSCLSLFALLELFCPFQKDGSYPPGSTSVRLLDHETCDGACDADVIGGFRNILVEPLSHPNPVSGRLV
jgi:hypothetical protein